MGICRPQGASLHLSGPSFTRVGFLCDLALQADGKVYESTLLFWLPWGLRKEMLQKTYPCKLAHPPTQPEDAHNESGTWYAHIPGASVTASPLEASLSIRIIPDNSQDRSPPNNNRQVHSLRIWIDGEGVCPFPNDFIAEFAKFIRCYIKDGNARITGHKQHIYI